MSKCNCGSGLERETVYDCQGIYLCSVCDKCKEEQLKKYRPEVFTGYDQSDMDESIEPEDY